MTAFQRAMCPSLPVRHRRAARAARDRRPFCRRGNTTWGTPWACTQRSFVREANPPSATASWGIAE